MTQFYFVSFKGMDRTTITVIDLDHCVSYERDEFSPVNDQNFSDHLDAIEHAKALACKYNLNYAPFVSRYRSELNETNLLTLD
ncbi:hypothetical protein P5704_026555 (plasmid) [Pseudomonas sp. FeN3W]|nr:hypothetical protein P5704_026555 [Pseudomonas sp. FeN3W]